MVVWGEPAPRLASPLEGKVSQGEDGGAPAPGTSPCGRGNRSARRGAALGGETGEGEERHAAARRPPPRRIPVRLKRHDLWSRARREGGDRERLHGGGPEEGHPDSLGPHGQDPERYPRRDDVRPSAL